MRTPVVEISRDKHHWRITERRGFMPLLSYFIMQLWSASPHLSAAMGEISFKHVIFLNNLVISITGLNK
jgi:hypothetical protein